MQAGEAEGATFAGKELPTKSESALLRVHFLHEVCGTVVCPNCESTLIWRLARYRTESCFIAASPRLRHTRDNRRITMAISLEKLKHTYPALFHISLARDREQVMRYGLLSTTAILVYAKLLAKSVHVPRTVSVPRQSRSLIRPASHS